MSPDSTPLGQLLALSHGPGREERRLAILGESYTPASTGADSFLIKANGSSRNDELYRQRALGLSGDSAF